MEMFTINKEDLTEFVNKIEDFDKAKNPQKIIIFGYYITNVANEPFFDQKHIRQCYELLDDSPPVNISDFFQKLRDSKKLVVVNGGYRVHRSEASKLDFLKKLITDKIMSSKENLENKSESPKDKEILQKSKSEQLNVVKTNDALKLINQFDTLQLPKFRIIGNYVRYDNTVRNTLKNMKQKVIEGLQPKSVGNENYLIWGPPGSGKSYFVQEIAKSLGNDIFYKELNLTKLDKDQFRSDLTTLEKIDKPCICLIDEVDSESSGEWAYEILLTHLFPSAPRKFRICFILAGSSGFNIEEMKKRIISHNKGTDLKSRILPKNEYVIPPLDIGDNLVVASSQLVQTAEKFNLKIKEVEKLALFYIAVDPQFSNARQVSELVVKSIKRIPTGEDRIKYDHLFDAGDPINKEFWEKAKSLDANLSNSFILIEDE